MLFIKAISVAGLVLPFQVHCLSVFVHKSCSDRSNWNAYFEESLNHARISVRRLDSASDTDFAAVFRRIFHTEKSSQTAAWARDMMKRVADLTITTDHKLSNIRIYCDNDSRFTAVVHGGITKYLDRENMMISKNQPSCLKQPPAEGRTYDRPTRNRSDGHNSHRVVITICDALMNEPDSGTVPRRLEDLNGKDMHDTLVKDLDVLVSATMLHELVHAVSLDSAAERLEILDQINPTNEAPDKYTAYGWDNIIEKDAETAIKNADNYAYLGIWASLADMGYTLPRLSEATDATLLAEAESDAHRGILRRYANITKRSLMGRMMRFFA
ncbi:hypothetical protein FB567DRAFT_92897 [Paraphoma chrysanthemicola]|uniref:Lysine-specific metallo-endopeptidase domain-containing protein n=1 Tax=Paraphoma chrysanthemicola TaxID=798071 RepID=A0A8K0R4N9_9PLEO|nr:hypothetical protein FB567DRAFT_92897 [Paraphoma chrysanthemicola]